MRSVVVVCVLLLGSVSAQPDGSSCVAAGEAQVSSGCLEWTVVHDEKRTNLISSPLGVFAAGSLDDDVWIGKINPETGEAGWSTTIDVPGYVQKHQRMAVDDTTLYVLADGQNGWVLVAITPDGAERWRLARGGSIGNEFGAEMLTVADKVYVLDHGRGYGTRGYHITAASTQDGSVAWTVHEPFNHNVFHSLLDHGLVVANDHLYAGLSSGLHAYTLDGHLTWQVDRTSHETGAVVWHQDTLLVAGRTNRGGFAEGHWSAYTPDGEHLWSTDGGAFPDMAAGAGGRVFSHEQGVLSAHDVATGNMLWHRGVGQAGFTGGSAALKVADDLIATVGWRISTNEASEIHPPYPTTAMVMDATSGNVIARGGSGYTTHDVAFAGDAVIGVAEWRGEYATYAMTYEEPLVREPLYEVNPVPVD